jgi:hypothetical protein
VLGLVSRSATANAQSAGQLWGTGTVTWLASDRLQLRVQAEPDAQLIVPEGQPTFFSVDTTPRALFIVAPWIDVLGEIDFGTKNQSNEVNTTSVTPRVGVQLHILSRILAGGGGGGREPESRQRLDFRSLLRFEENRQKPSTNSSFSSSWTFRDRFRMSYPLNRPKVTSSGAVYLATDTEAFVPLDEGFINELRVRSGVGYRHSFPWRFEALYVWTGERSRPSEPIAVKNQALDLRVYFQF